MKFIVWKVPVGSVESCTPAKSHTASSCCTVPLGSMQVVDELPTVFLLSEDCLFSLVRWLFGMVALDHPPEGCLFPPLRWLIIATPSGCSFSLVRWLFIPTSKMIVCCLLSLPRRLLRIALKMGTFCHLSDDYLFVLSSCVKFH